MSQLARMSQNQKPRHSASGTRQTLSQKTTVASDDDVGGGDYLKVLESNIKQAKNKGKPTVPRDRERLGQVAHFSNFLPEGSHHRCCVEQ